MKNNRVIYAWEPLEISSSGRRSRAKRITYSDRKAAVDRLVRKSPEVMVKVSGGGKTTQHVMAHLTYITRNGKLEAVDENGDKLSSKDDMTDLLKEWGTDIAKGAGKNKLVFNVVLSMPKGTPPDKLLQAVREFAKQEFLGERQYAMVLHEPNTDPSKTKAEHPHVHLVIKAAGFDGSRLYIRKATLEKWRSVFAEKLREQGVDANATPRELRGVIQRGNKSAVVYAGKRNQSHVLKNRFKEAKAQAQTEANTISPTDKPIWKRDIEDKRRLIIKGYSAAEKELRGQGDAALADKLAKYVKELPPTITAQERLVEQIKKNDLIRRAQSVRQPDAGKGHRGVDRKPIDRDSEPDR